MLKALLNDLKQNISIKTVSTKFHNTLAEMVVTMAYKIGEPQIALSGGCFQNRYLTERAVHRLQAEGFRPYWHHQIPPNDGGISVGQIIGAQRTIKRKAN
jgi:hydrogenase maturation protein HypF